LLLDKLSLTGVLSDFMTAIKSTPLLATLNGITINCSGSPILCLNIPYKGEVCKDFSSYQSIFNSVGTLFLSLTTISSLLWVFSGNRG